MNNSLYYLRLFLLATSGMLLLCTIFAINPELANGTFSGRICWFHFTALLLAGSVLLMEFTTRKSRFIFSLPDALLLLLFGIVLITYDKDRNLQPFPFYSPAHYTLVYAQEYVAGTSGTPSLFHHNHHIYGDRSGHMGNL